MRKIILLAILFSISRPSSAEIQSYQWTGAVDQSGGGLAVGENVSGAFKLDLLAPVDFVTPVSTRYRTFQDVTFNAGPDHYSMPGSNIFMVYNKGFYVQDAPLSASDKFTDFSLTLEGMGPLPDTSLENSRDLDQKQFSLAGWAAQVFDSTTHTISEAVGHIVSIYKEAYFPSSRSSSNGDVSYFPGTSGNSCN